MRFTSLCTETWPWEFVRFIIIIHKHMLDSAKAISTWVLLPVSVLKYLSRRGYTRSVVCAVTTETTPGAGDPLVGVAVVSRDPISISFSPARFDDPQ